jgi:hypothetical protein
MIGGEEFRFEPEPNHSYFLGNKRLIGVSEAIKAAALNDFSMIKPEVLEHAAQRGKAVHAACHYLDDGDLNWATVSPEIEPYVRAWERFKAETGVELLEIETPRYHATLGFAGTPDRIVKFGPNVGVLDLKTFNPSDVTGVQLSAYSVLRFGPQPSFNAPKRWGLWLRDDGKYSLTSYEDRGDEAVFLACLTICKFKMANK